LNLAIGFILGLIVSLGCYLARLLTLRGAISAGFVGGLIFALGGITPAILLLTFFVSSSALSHVGSSKKLVFANSFEKGSQRDQGQVLANGGIAAGLSLILALTEMDILMVGIAGAIAAVTADTWSTELGVLAKRKPRLITSGARVERGTSGAITLEGTIASILGALLIGLISAFFLDQRNVALPVTLAGIGGAIVDSILGASVQAMYYCADCDKATEHHPYHSCGTRTIHIQGWLWMSNDIVNLISSFVGAMLSMVLWRIL
jgi:uncharacterized protein (TIGR00297 family)